MTDATQLIQYGAIGICLLLAIGAIIKLYADLEREKAARLADARKFADIVIASTNAQRESTVASSEQARLLARLTESIAAMSGQMAMLKRD